MFGGVSVRFYYLLLTFGEPFSLYIETFAGSLLFTYMYTRSVVFAFLSEPAKASEIKFIWN